MALVILLALTGLQTAAAAATPVEDPRTPELPSPLCDRVRVPEGNNLQSRMYATGVQVYKWDGASWVLVEPIASLFANPDYTGKLGIHYRGPAWESNSGSKVVSTRLFGCSPDTTAIPWLLLETVSTTGPGIFSSVTYIQRLNTSGGLAPAGPGSAIGELVQVPYTAEYLFYREQ
jgi:hypothetical protein